MKTVHSIKSFFIVLLFSWMGTACTIGSADLQSEGLPIALVDDLYEEYFSLNEHWNGYFNYDYAFYWTDGELPIGLEVTDSGRLIGVPESTGHFNFEIEVYAIDYDGFEDFVDSGWFTLFVTEGSTNSNCPHPASQTTSELYVCLGHLEKDEVRAGDRLLFDVNYYVNPSRNKLYSVDKIVYQVNYDPAIFEVDSDTLNSSLLREAALSYEGLVSFDTSVEGIVKVTVTSLDKGFRRAGRLMNLPLFAKADLALESYDFELNVLEMTGHGLPEIIGLDGRLEVEDPIVADDDDEEAAEEEEVEA